MSERQVHLSQHAAGVIQVAFEKTQVTLGTMQLKSGIAAKIDKLKGPMVQSWDMSDPERPVPAMTVPETGPGYEQYRITGGPLALTPEEAKHIKENFDSIMEDKGFPAKMASGVYEANAALMAWTADIVEE
jgi:hypothetical protein